MKVAERKDLIIAQIRQHAFEYCFKEWSDASDTGNSNPLLEMQPVFIKQSLKNLQKLSLNDLYAIILAMRGYALRHNESVIDFFKKCEENK